MASAQPLVTFANLGRLGRLGNQLFQIAATIGVAHRHGVEAAFPEWRYSRYFAHPPRCDLPRTFEASNICREIDRRYRPIEGTPPLDLFGFFQSERYFESCLAEVRHALTPLPGLIARLATRHHAVLDQGCWSLHVRRGDYQGHPHFTDLSASGYYERALEHAPPDVPILIFSDDPDWSSARFTDARFVLSPHAHEIEDLVLMSLCSGHIIANSSFSWWGAWLGDRPGKPVIAPATWFAGAFADPTLPYRSYGFEFGGFHDTVDLLPSRWHRLA